jgi:hypothetical protein
MNILTPLKVVENLYLYVKDSGEGVPGDMLVLPVEVSPSQVTSENKDAIL